jgi:hypothetical protein
MSAWRRSLCRPRALPSAAPARSPTGWSSCTASTSGGPWSRCCASGASTPRSSIGWSRRWCASTGGRAVDPFDEIAYLDLECERLGAAWAGRYVKTRVGRGLNEHVPAALFHFYRSYRAMLRARLAIAHLSEPAPRTPEKWPRRARAYLNIAIRDATRLETLLSAQQGP